MRPKAPERPNVVIYLIDALRRDHLGVYGYQRNTSPHIDAFARDAVVYDDAYSTTVWTKPAVASILTGLTPVRHGVQDRRHYLPDNVPLLAEFLKKIGYATTAVVTNPHASAQWGFGRGFDDFDETKNWAGTRADEVNAAVFPYLTAARSRSSSTFTRSSRTARWLRRIPIPSCSAATRSGRACPS
jgi:arylsulfatase A-like enzyme